MGVKENRVISLQKSNFQVIYHYYLLEQDAAANQKYYFIPLLILFCCSDLKQLIFFRYER